MGAHNRSFSFVFGLFSLSNCLYRLPLVYGGDARGQAVLICLWPCSIIHHGGNVEPEDSLDQIGWVYSCKKKEKACEIGVFTYRVVVG